MLCNLDHLNQRLLLAHRVWLFLDYDGTLADLADTPEQVIPNRGLIRLLTGLAGDRHLRSAVISGRSLGQLRTLLPVPGMLLAGSYGIELQLPDGTLLERLDYAVIRPTLDNVKPRWADLISSRRGFFLEDKGWTLALHARFACDSKAEEVLECARQLAHASLSLAPLRLQGGHKFLEICPRLANKGTAVEYLLEQYAWPGALPVYVGDDDKDEDAFEVIKARSGLALLVSRQVRASRADCRLESPRAVRRWLRMLAARLRRRTTPAMVVIGLRGMLI
jgi:trehalose 6-phosphate phosphatase